MVLIKSLRARGSSARLCALVLGGFFFVISDIKVSISLTREGGSRRLSSDGEQPGKDVPRSGSSSGTTDETL